MILKTLLGERSPKLVSLHPSKLLSRVKLSMLTFKSPNVCPKWSNSSRSTIKMTIQSFGPILHRDIIQKTLEWLYQKNIKIVPKSDKKCASFHIFALCWIVQSVPKDRKQKMRLNFAVDEKE
jgi:hypothetical protein